MSNQEKLPLRKCSKKSSLWKISFLTFSMHLHGTIIFPRKQLKNCQRTNSPFMVIFSFFKNQMIENRDFVTENGDFVPPNVLVKAHHTSYTIEGDSSTIKKHVSFAQIIDKPAPSYNRL